MGAASSIVPEVFTLAKDEYEVKKGEGLTDEELFNHMKSFINEKTAELDKPQPEAVATVETAASVEVAAETAAEPAAEPAAETAAADAPQALDLENMAPPAGDEAAGASSG